MRGQHAVLVNLMLLHCLGQPLPLHLVLVLRIQRLHLLCIIDGRRRWVAQLDLAVLVADHNILGRCGNLEPLRLEMAVVLLLVLVLPLGVRVEVQRITC